MKRIRWMILLAAFVLLPMSAWAEATLPPMMTPTPRPAEMEAHPTPMPALPTDAIVDIPQLPTASTGELLEENVVYVLPTAEPMFSLQLDVAENEYAIDLEAFYSEYRSLYDSMGGEYMWYPALTTDELQRFPQVKARYVSGERPSLGVINRTENVSVGVYPLPAELYQGEPVFLILPYRTLTDEEMLMIIDGYASLGLEFDPYALSWRNCMRGGVMEMTRGYAGDESQRLATLTDMYRRGGLVPEDELSPVPVDDGLGWIKLNPAEFCMKETFYFLPARQLTDSELLKMAALNLGQTQYDGEDYIQWESLTRLNMHNLMGMPISTTRIHEELYEADEKLKSHRDDRKLYAAEFEPQSPNDHSVWEGWLSVEDGSLAYASVQYLRTGGISARMDPYLPKWTDIALDWVKKTRNDGVDVAQTENYGEISLSNVDYGVQIHVLMEDGSHYRVCISYAEERPDFVIYMDAHHSRLVEEYNVNHAYEDAMRGWGE
ncbi:MAG: hypothetical protein J6K72_09020 [Clostridia bacterium]|nr:hypothetical protein [Clostridia bacterium]